MWVWIVKLGYSEGTNGGFVAIHYIAKMLRNREYKVNNYVVWSGKCAMITLEWGAVKPDS